MVSFEVNHHLFLGQSNSADVKSNKKGLKGFGQKMSDLFTKLVLGEPEPEIEIGAPYNFQHVQHVQADPHSSTGFSVLKCRWYEILEIINLKHRDCLQK